MTDEIEDEPICLLLSPARACSDKVENNGLKEPSHVR